MTTAQKMFDENIKHLGPKSGLTRPLEHNLYRGLYALAGEVATIQMQLAILTRRLEALSQEIRKLK